MFARHGLPKHIKSDNGQQFIYYDTNVTWRRNESHNNTRLYCGHKQMTNWKGKFGVKILDRGTKTRLCECHRQGYPDPGWVVVL